MMDKYDLEDFRKDMKRRFDELSDEVMYERSMCLLAMSAEKSMSNEEKDIIHKMICEQINESKGMQEMLRIMLGDWEEYDNE
jgi:hypothetical protein